MSCITMILPSWRNILHALCCFVVMISAPVWAASDPMLNMQARADINDRRSLIRGARTFANYCLGCHSASYMRYSRLGEDLGISETLLKANLMFGTDKIGDTMQIAMTRDQGEQFFGAPPPDLSVIARARGADWLYTYLMTFYQDESRPNGVNNLRFKDVAMPHVLWEMQGLQKAVYKTVVDEKGAARKVFDRFELLMPGSQSTKEYTSTVRDLVNFMVYLGEPARLQRYKIGGWVIAYLFIFLIIAYLLKREYWKDVK